MSKGTKSKSVKANATPAPIIERNERELSPKEIKQRIDALLSDLRVARDAKDRKAGKKIRRHLRKLGHTGGLRLNVTTTNA